MQRPSSSSSVVVVLVCLFCLQCVIGQSDEGMEEYTLDNMPDMYDEKLDATAVLQIGNLLAHASRADEAMIWWQRAADLKPDSNVPYNNIANHLMGLGKHHEALEIGIKAAKIKADPLSLTTLGNCYKAVKQYENAANAWLEGVERVRNATNPYEQFEHPFWALGGLMKEQGDYIEAYRYHKEGFDYISRSEDDEKPKYEISVMRELYDVSLALAMHSARHKRWEEAYEYIVTALQMSEDSMEANRHAACIATKMQRGDLVSEYMAAYQRSRLARPEVEVPGGDIVTRNPTGKWRFDRGDGEWCSERWWSSDNAYFRLSVVRAMACEWRQREDDAEDLHRHMEINTPQTLILGREFNFECEDGLVCGVGSPPPMHAWSFDMSPAEILNASKSHYYVMLRNLSLTEDSPMTQFPYPSWEPKLPQRLRIGYLTGDLMRNHPVGNMMKAVLRLHDFYRHEIIVFLCTEMQVYRSQDPAMKPFVGNVTLLSVHAFSHAEAAMFINEQGIHVLWDLSGHTTDNRQETLFYRPAAVQGHYHGFIATCGAPYIAYYAGDKVLTPPEMAPWFSEKMAYLPGSFLGPSHRFVHTFFGRGPYTGVTGREGTEGEMLARYRKENGVVGDGPVICYFNQHFKIDPRTFKVWTDAMHQLPGSFLWMLSGAPNSRRNLRREFAASGLAPERMAYAARVDPADHIIRTSLCDIAVDSPMYNSGATGADTLYAGVPLITLPGAKPAGRMQASMLPQVGLGGMHRPGHIGSGLTTIVRNHDEYLELILKILKPKNQWKLHALRQRLARGILRGSLYDIIAWVADYELLTRLMWDVRYSTQRDFHVIPVRPESGFLPN